MQVALEVNPQVRAARARWESAEHSIKQAYAPNDPQVSYTNGDSAGDGFSRSSYHTLLVSEAFQFPGKALLQGTQARRSAEIARLMYEATVRDTRAAVETAYYQLVLDSALADVNAENVRNLEQVLKVTQVAYSANQVTQTDFISAEFDLAAARQLQLQYKTNIENDETALNQLLSRAARRAARLRAHAQVRGAQDPARYAGRLARKACARRFSRPRSTSAIPIRRFSSRRWNICPISP